MNFPEVTYGAPCGALIKCVIYTENLPIGPNMKAKLTCW